MGETLGALVERRLKETRSPALVIDELILAAGVTIGSFVKPEHIEESLYRARLAMAQHARATLAEAQPGVQRQ